MSATRPVRLLALAAVLIAPTAFAAKKADVANGKMIFEQLCGICHASNSDGSGEGRGPSLFGLIGRKAGTEPNYAMYTPELKAYKVKWSVKTLDAFLSNPMSKVPGTAMPLMMPDNKQRADVVAYIASLK